MPFFHVALTSSVAQSFARAAILSILGTLEEANTIRELVRATRVPVPPHVDSREARFATCYWMQPRTEVEWQCAFREPRLPRSAWNQ